MKQNLRATKNTQKHAHSSDIFLMTSSLLRKVLFGNKECLHTSRTSNFLPRQSSRSITYSADGRSVFQLIPMQTRGKRKHDFAYDLGLKEDAKLKKHI